MFSENKLRDFVKDSIAPLLAGSELLPLLNEMPIANIRRIRAESKAIDLHGFLEIFLEEAVQTLKLIEKHCDGNSILLEVGGGIGLINIYLQISGYNICSIEPSAGGHDDYYKIGSYLISELKLDEKKWLSLEAEELDFPAGQFDLIFSNNVLEHIETLDAALISMKHCLNENGLMRHACPNYLIPYEPHYGILLLPGLERLTSFFLPSLKKEALWRSLNFIKAHSLERTCSSNGLSIEFDPKTTYNSVQRLLTDENFAARHTILLQIFTLISKTPVSEWIKKLPPRWSTPMSFSLRISGQA